ncbi:hypothetical protein [Streptomyces flaveus]|uniref:hypothetical protein n=1 Tax=Streptomyces flaveus TaxID=66370 RepID=UPI00332E267A
MSSQPPGPPVGPLPPPPPGPGPPPGAGPGPSRWRSRKFLALIITGVVVLAGLVVLLVVLLPGDDGGGTAGDSPSPTSPSPTSPSPLSSAEAHELAGRVALTPEDWGSGFSAPSEGYEYSPVGELTVLENCQLVDKSDRPGTLASLNRSVVTSDAEVGGYSEVRVYADTATAETYMADVNEAIHRCASQRYDGSRFDGIREAAPPPLTGFDELVAEEGRQTMSDGTKVDLHFTVLTGRTGEIVLEAHAYGSKEALPETRKRAGDALALMQKRLRDDTAAPSPATAR